MYRCKGQWQNAQLKQKLNSGDQVEIMTSNTQTPKQDWLNIVTTSKARTKIRQALKEMVARQHDFAKETLERKFKNRKMEYDEGTMMRLIKRLGYKVVTEFYQAIADGTLDVNDLLDKYIEQQKRDNDTHDEIVYRSAEGYNLQNQIEETNGKEDVLVIDQNLKGLEFKLAKCCNPIYGDEVFGFVTCIRRYKDSPHGLSECRSNERTLWISYCKSPLGRKITGNAIPHHTPCSGT